jgi:hypothetical protein
MSTNLFLLYKAGEASLIEAPSRASEAVRQEVLELELRFRFDISFSLSLSENYL